MRLFMALCLVSLVGCGQSRDLPAPTSTPSPPSNPHAPIDEDSISSMRKCSKVDAGSGISVYFEYEAVVYSTGDVWIMCSMSNNVGQYTETTIYKSTQAGAVTGGCLVGADIDVASSGYWNFILQGTTAKTTYNDPASAHNSYSYTFASADCVNL